MGRIVVWGFCLFACLPAFAHKPSDAYLSLDAGDRVLHGQWDMALRDLDGALGLDANQDGAITWGELRARHADIAAHALARLAIAADGAPCALSAREHLVDEHTDGAYAVMRFDAACPAKPSRLAIDYRLFFDQDRQHKGLVRLTQGNAVHTLILDADRRDATVTLAANSASSQFRDTVREGVWHIWLGTDHLLFLLSLLLPAVFIRRGGAWEAAPSFRTAAWDVARVVTAFTVAHSLTLALAAFGWVVLPSRLVESAIAISVIAAAVNNVLPFLTTRRWAMAFGFGLVHGFGFAGALSDLGLSREALAWPLLAFNVGVEAGQLAIVAVFLPLAWRLRDAWIYRRVVFIAGSLGVAAVAMAWLVERALDVKLLG
ncbi:MAG: HupE/UreJ family protein [Burkholderiales bacterium]